MNDQGVKVRHTQKMRQAVQTIWGRGNQTRGLLQSSNDIPTLKRKNIYCEKERKKERKKESEKKKEEKKERRKKRRE